MILNLRSLYLSTEEYSWMDTAIYIIATATIIVIMYIRRRIAAYSLKMYLTVLIITTVYLISFYFINQYDFSAFCKYLITVIIVLLYCFSTNGSFDSTMAKYCNLVEIIAFVSLFFWIFVSLLHIIPATGTVMSGWTGGNGFRACDSYFNIYFETQIQFIPGFGSIIRNTAIFTEAPMASFVFLLAYLYRIYLGKKNKKSRIILLIVAVISTLSIAGISLLIISTGLLYISQRTSTNTEQVLKVIIAPIIIVAGTVAVISVVGTKLTLSSGLTRMDDIQAGYMAWRNSPIIGNGFGNTQSYQHYMSNFRITNRGFSNSIFQILAYGGIYLFLPYFVCIIKNIYSCLHNQRYNLLFFFIMFLTMFAITIVPFQMLTIYIFVSLTLFFSSNEEKRRAL